MIYLFIYLVGVVVTLRLLKDWRTYRGFNEWSDVICMFIYSLFSWIGFVMVLSMICVYFLRKFTNNTKPPK